MADGEHGVTEHGFVLKRMDEILETIHGKLSDGYGYDTTRNPNSLLNILVTTFSGEISDLWEVAQDEYYAKYPATAMGLNLDNAVQYAGIRRLENRQSIYPLHCTGDDGTTIYDDAVVATSTLPEVRLVNADEFTISREDFNSAVIVIAALEAGIYSVVINGETYEYENPSDDTDEETILAGIAAAITDTNFTVEVKDGGIEIKDKTVSRSNEMALSENLTTQSVTTIASFLTEDYGKIVIPNGTITNIVNSITGFSEVTNLIKPTYGRLRETDIQLRHSHLNKAALLSNYMVDSVCAYILDNVDSVETAYGYQNDTDTTDALGLAPHSIEIIVDGGDETEIAQAILKKKAGGIQTNGKIVVNVPGLYGDQIPVRFNRPEYMYTWLKVVLHGSTAKIATNYAELTQKSIIDFGNAMQSGTSLLIQLLMDGIYDNVPGVTYVDITSASSTDEGYTPSAAEYQGSNVVINERQKIVLSTSRIEVSFVEDS